MSDVKRVAVVGAGRQAREDHIPAITASSRTELVAICDPDSRVRADMAAATGVPCRQDLSTVLEHDRPDFVVVAAPHHAHRLLTETAVRRGVHVLKEKPFAVTVAEARALRSLAAESQVEIMTTLQRRFNPTYTSFFQLVGQIGTPFSVDVQYTLGVEHPEEGWRGQRAKAGGGCLIDMGYHMLDLVIWYLGLPTTVCATLSAAAVPGAVYDAEDTANVLMSWSSGLHGTMRISRAMPPKTERFRLVGDRGAIEIERGVIRRFDASGALQEELRRLGGWASAAISQVEYFCDVVDHRAANEGGPDYHVQHVAFLDAAYRSARLGRAVQLEEVMT